MGIWVVFVFRFEVRVIADTFSDVHELNLLLFRCGTPALEPSLIKCANDFIQRVSFFLTAMHPTWVRILRIKLRFLVTKFNAVVKLHTLQTV